MWQALRKLLRVIPNPELNFSNVVKNTSNSTRSKSEKKKQTDSSEDTNFTLKIFENFGIEEDKSPTVPTYGDGYYIKGKGKKKRCPPAPPLTVGGVRVKKTIK